MSQKPYPNIKSNTLDINNQKLNSLEPVSCEQSYTQPVLRSESSDTSGSIGDFQGKEFNKKTPLPQISNTLSNNGLVNGDCSSADPNGGSGTNYKVDTTINVTPKTKMAESKNMSEDVGREGSVFGLTSVKYKDKEHAKMSTMEESDQTSVTFHDLSVSPVPTPKVT